MPFTNATRSTAKRVASKIKEKPLRQEILELGLEAPQFPEKRFVLLGASESVNLGIHNPTISSFNPCNTAGDFINRCLMLLLAYAYPGFECYKTVEKNRVDIEELRFWCKYWIIVALFTVLERFTDIFVGWLPLYGEIKLVFFVYLWYPKTRGTGYVYGTVLRPYVSRHENDIDRKLLEWKARSWDYVIFYWQYCAKFGHTAFVQALQHLASQSIRLSPIVTTQKNEVQSQNGAAPASIQTQASLMKQSSTLSQSKKWPPSPPSSPMRTPVKRNISLTRKPRVEEEEGDEKWDTETIKIDGADDEQQPISVKDRISLARARLRPVDAQSPRSPHSPRTPQRKQV
ncbi:hypothetical protein VNO77_15863 [Canavalia gladiata]|uniref:HVA22-like protein n=1 Tax=Canavalia gladiata TaxID=3824 RepID=A0AAN9LZH6_CANGL